MDPDTITACALEILEGSHPTRFDVPPSESVRTNIISQLFSAEQRHDLHLFEQTCPATLRQLSRNEQVTWANDVRKNAKSEVVRSKTANQILGVFLQDS
jgi:hypothetical protein